MPYSDKVLTETQLEEKIEKLRSHIEHLTNQIAQRNTHGGKRFRHRKISLQDQRITSTKELDLLVKAKKKGFRPRMTAFRKFSKKSD